MAWTPISRATKWDTADRSDRALQMGTHVCQRSDEVKHGRPQTHWTGHAEGRASLSVERRSEIQQNNQTGHAAGRTRLSEEQHAENGVHHLSLLLFNNFCSHNWKTLSSSLTCREQQRVDNTAAMPKKVTAKLAKNFGGKTNHWKLKDLSRTPATMCQNMTWFNLGHA